MSGTWHSSRYNADKILTNITPQRSKHQVSCNGKECLSTTPLTELWEREAEGDVEEEGEGKEQEGKTFVS